MLGKKPRLFGLYLFDVVPAPVALPQVQAHDVRHKKNGEDQARQVEECRDIELLPATRNKYIELRLLTLHPYLCIASYV